MKTEENFKKFNRKDGDAETSVDVLRLQALMLIMSMDDKALQKAVREYEEEITYGE